LTARPVCGRTGHPVATTSGPYRAEHHAYLVELADTGHYQTVTQTTVDLDDIAPPHRACGRHRPQALQRRPHPTRPPRRGHRDDRGTRAHQALRRQDRRRHHQLHHRSRLGHQVPRAERCREVDDHAHDHGSGPADVRQRHCQRQALRAPPCPAGRGRRPAGGKRRAPRPPRPSPSSWPPPTGRPTTRTCGPSSPRSSGSCRPATRSPRPSRRFSATPEPSAP
jgi:hypothetical protein